MFCDLFYGDLTKGQNNYSSLFHSKCCPFGCTAEVLPSIETSQLLRSSLFLDVTQRSEDLIFTQKPAIILLVLFFQENFGFWHSTLYSFWKLQKSLFLVTVNDWFQEDIYLSLMYKQVMRYKFWGYYIGVAEGSVLFDRLCVTE